MTGFGLSKSGRDRLRARYSGSRPIAGTALEQPRPPLGDPARRAELDLMRRASAALGIESPYFRIIDGIAGANATIAGREVGNFVSYDYLGLNGDTRVSAAAKAAIDRFGTTVSASRIVSGERAFHRELERDLADLHGTEDCLSFVSGFATNVTVIGHLVGPGDRVIHDAQAHNSIVQGALLSGAERVSFRHNDLADLERRLDDARGAHRLLVVIEGLYSMDGDVAPVREIAGLCRHFRAHLMVDEAHSVGVLGATGRGSAELFGPFEPDDVTLWMGTLSKALCSAGGYIAGPADLIDHLRCSCPGFVYSVGLAPPVAAAARAALAVMAAEPQRVEALARAGGRFLAAARAAGLDTGTAIGRGVIPVLTGSSILAARVAARLFQRSINVQPILYPAVPEREARLRFFVTARHEAAQIDATVAATAEALAEARATASPLADLAAIAGG